LAIVKKLTDGHSEVIAIFHEFFIECKIIGKLSSKILKHVHAQAVEDVNITCLHKHACTPTHTMTES